MATLLAVVRRASRAALVPRRPAAPPQRPGGPDALRRNRIPIAAAALLAAAAAEAYLVHDEREPSPALAEMSGRDESGRGGFRSE